MWWEGTGSEMQRKNILVKNTIKSNKFNCQNLCWHIQVNIYDRNYVHEEYGYIYMHEENEVINIL